MDSSGIFPLSAAERLAGLEERNRALADKVSDMVTRDHIAMLEERMRISHEGALRKELGVIIPQMREVARDEAEKSFRLMTAELDRRERELIDARAEAKTQRDAANDKMRRDVITNVLTAISIPAVIILFAGLMGLGSSEAIEAAAQFS